MFTQYLIKHIKTEFCTEHKDSFTKKHSVAMRDCHSPDLHKNTDSVTKHRYFAAQRHATVDPVLFGTK